jgi:hypothetical protein
MILHDGGIAKVVKVALGQQGTWVVKVWPLQPPADASAEAVAAHALAGQQLQNEISVATSSGAAPHPTVIQVVACATDGTAVYTVQPYGGADFAVQIVAWWAAAEEPEKQSQVVKEITDSLADLLVGQWHMVEGLVSALGATGLMGRRWDAFLICFIRP